MLPKEAKKRRAIAPTSRGCGAASSQARSRRGEHGGRDGTGGCGTRGPRGCVRGSPVRCHPPRWPCFWLQVLRGAQRAPPDLKATARSGWRGLGFLDPGAEQRSCC
jgi:hypothetical protein